MVCITVPAAATAAASTAGEAAFLSSAYIASGIGASSFASTLATVGTYASLAGTALSGLGMFQQSRAANQSSKYNASIAAMNQDIANQNSIRAGQVGNQQVEEQQLKTRAEVGQIISNTAASGLESTTGSAADVIRSATEIGQLNALSIRANATQQAYGYKNQAAGYGAESGLYRSSAKNDALAGYISSGSTILSGVGNSSLTYGKFLKDNSTF